MKLLSLHCVKSKFLRPTRDRWKWHARGPGLGLDSGKVRKGSLQMIWLWTVRWAALCDLSACWELLAWLWCVGNKRCRSRKVSGRWVVVGGLGQRAYLSSPLAWRMPSGRRQRVTDIPVGPGTVLGIQLMFKPHTLWGISVICVTWDSLLSWWAQCALHGKCTEWSCFANIQAN